MRDRNEHLEAEISKRVDEIALLQEVAIMALASLAETRDCETETHIQRTTQYVRELAQYLQSQAIFPELLTAENVDLIAKSTPLHDIGKVGIPDMILWKPAMLNNEEFELVKRYPAIGRRAIEGAEKLLATPESFLRFAKDSGIQVETVHLSAGEMIARVRAEKNSPQASVLYGGSADGYIQANAEGLLEIVDSAQRQHALRADMGAQRTAVTAVIVNGHQLIDEADRRLTALTAGH